MAASKEKYSMGMHLALLTEALDAVEKYHAAERKVRNTAYPRDAENAAQIAKDRMDQAIAAAKNYGGLNA